MYSLEINALRNDLVAGMESDDRVSKVSLKDSSDYSVDGRVLFEDGRFVPIWVKFDSKREYGQAETRWNPDFKISRDGKVYLDGELAGYFMLNKRPPETQRHLVDPSSVNVYVDLVNCAKFDPSDPSALVDFVYENGSE